MSQDEGQPTEVIQSTAVETTALAVLPPPSPPRRWGGMSEVQGGPFAQWMKDFCHWKVTTKPRPTTIEQMREASRLSGINIHRRALQWLLTRKDVDAYLCLLSADGLERAKHRMKTDLEFYAELHRLGAEMALDAKDHRSIAAYTVPALDRILPRRQEAVKHEPIVVIQVTQAQADKLEREPLPNEMVVEAEIVVEEDENGRS